ncbi:MAG: hypothetical protein HW384_946 [Dehalococcoidia bacterium]|nr:hypothetical protein [Dehalococcoidia bacterium]
MADNKPLICKRPSEYKLIGDQSFFPVSWLHKQGFCEYQIYLEIVKGVKLKPTKQMIVGKEEHERLYSEFKAVAVPATFDRMLDLSKTEVVSSREFRVRDVEHGIYGLVDEILMTPDQYIIIDDKPGTTAYPSQINQVYGYCLAFKGVIKSVDNRRIISALRKRGSNLIFWQGTFDDPAERSIAALVQHIHALMSGSEQFGTSDNPNKCRACSLKAACDRALVS